MLLPSPSQPRAGPHGPCRAWVPLQPAPTPTHTRASAAPHGLQGVCAAGAAMTTRRTLSWHPSPPPSPTCTLSLHTAPPPHLQGVSCWSGNDDEAHAGRHGHHSLVSLAASLVASLAASLAASRSDPTPVCPPCTHPPPLLPHPLWPAGQPQTLACPTIQSADLSAPCHQADAHNLLANSGSTVPLCQAGSPWPPSPPPGWSTPPPSHR